MNKIKLQKTGEFILDLIFPRFCLGCHKEGTWLCPNCQSKIIKIQTPTCLLCQKIEGRGLCSRCRKKLPLTGVISAGYYRDPVLKEAIHILKYERVREVVPILSEYLLQAVQKYPWPKNCLLMPVPLNYWRHADRGFNQSELIARYLSERLNWPIALDILKRPKATKPQIELNPKDRHKNIKNAFTIQNPQKIKGKTIILVDDVITTGATVGECARILRLSGARRIWALSIARG